jgi:antirestriction protein ArdC
MNTDVYARVMQRILAELEQGERPWMKRTPPARSPAPALQWRALRRDQRAHALGRSHERGYSAPIWMTFRQARELGGHVRKGEHGSLVVYASRVPRTERDAATGEDVEREIPFMKGYTVFNVEQIDALPAQYYAMAQAPLLAPAQRLARLEAFFTATGPTSATAATGHSMPPPPTMCRCPPLNSSATRKAITPRWPIPARPPALPCPGLRAGCGTGCRITPRRTDRR